MRIMTIDPFTFVLSSKAAFRRVLRALF